MTRTSLLWRMWRTVSAREDMDCSRSETGSWWAANAFKTSLVTSRLWLRRIRSLSSPGAGGWGAGREEEPSFREAKRGAAMLVVGHCRSDIVKIFLRSESCHNTRFPILIAGIYTCIIEAHAPIFTFQRVARAYYTSAPVRNMPPQRTLLLKNLPENISKRDIKTFFANRIPTKQDEGIIENVGHIYKPANSHTRRAVVTFTSHKTAKEALKLNNGQITAEAADPQDASGRSLVQIDVEFHGLTVLYEPPLCESPNIELVVTFLQTLPLLPS